MSVLPNKMNRMSMFALSALCVSLLASPLVFSQDVKSPEQWGSDGKNIIKEKIVGSSKSLNKKIDLGSYMIELHNRIRRAWFPPKSNNSKKVVVVFQIEKDGEFKGLHLIHSSGIRSMDEAGLQAVCIAAPFKPLPDNASESIDVQFEFDCGVSAKKSNSRT